jgi:hypothetical protein
VFAFLSRWQQPWLEPALQVGQKESADQLNQGMMLGAASQLADDPLVLCQQQIWV